MEVTGLQVVRRGTCFNLRDVKFCFRRYKKALDISVVTTLIVTLAVIVLTIQHLLLLL